MLKSGSLYKLGEGPINYDWNLRFFVLDETNQELAYYSNDQEIRPRAIINIVDALVSNITLIKDREFSFSIQTAPPIGKTYFFSSDSRQDATEWRQALISASTKHKIHSQGPFTTMQSAVPNKIIPKQFLDNEEEEREILNDQSEFYDIQQFARQSLVNQGNVGHQSFPQRSSFQASSHQNLHHKQPSLQHTESIDEQVELEKNTIKKNLYHKNKIFGDKKDVGNISSEQMNQLNQIQNYIKEDSGDISSPQNNWQTIQFMNGVVISALNPQQAQITLEKKKLKGYFKNLALYILVFYAIRKYVFELNYFWLGIVISYLNFKQLSGLVSITEKYSKLKARAIIKGDPDEIGQSILEGFRSNNSQTNFDLFIIHTKLVSSDEDKHVFVTEETLDLPQDFFGKVFIERRMTKMITYWCKDEMGSFFVLRKSLLLPDSKGRSLNKIQEAFVVVPLSSKSETSILYYFSDFNYGTQGNGWVMNSLTQDKIRLLRMSNLAAFIDSQKYSQELKLKQVYETTKKVVETEQFEDHNMSGFEKEDDIDKDKISISSNQGESGQANFKKTSILQRMDTITKRNKENIYVKQGQRIGLSERFPGYFRTENGALWCHNQEDLASQSGIVVELLQKAGKKLMEGKGIVAISLPVRIFEKRSTVEKICDLWCTGPYYLRRAAIESDPLERLKLVITFVVSGMHQMAPQRKPFNPIVGETYQGVWPDGSSIYVEHISHHPPISCFLVESSENLYTFEGSYEYTVKMTDYGKSATGKQVGKNRVHFQDGGVIEFEYPAMKISGLLFGKRLSYWLGSFEFEYKKQNLKAKLEFSPMAGLFSRNSLPLDIIQGSITYYNVELSKIQGSWLECLKFDDKIYWELETCDTIKPVPSEQCLPSDCRYREDSNAFALGDLVLSQSEKERLEELQRADRRLREEAAKKRKFNQNI